ncbi:MAG TPA: hypothetical protein VF753_16870 [Terriglobales bacterium]
MEGNNNLTEAARAALKRIYTLRDLTKKTGLATYQKQYEVVLSLGNEDAIAVADVLGTSLTKPPVANGGGR